MRANGQFDPVARASELLSEKWMSLILRELMLGTTRYGELIRALPTLSQPLLSKRLRELLDAGVIERRGERMAARYAESMKAVLRAPDLRSAPRSLVDYVLPSAFKPTWRTRIPRPIKNFIRMWMERFGISS